MLFKGILTISFNIKKCPCKDFCKHYNNDIAEILLKSTLQEYLINEFLIYYPVWFRARVFPPPAVESRVERVEGRREGAADVEPPVTGSHGLGEHRAIGAQK